MARKKKGARPTDMLTPAEAARYLKIGKGAITKAVNRGRLAVTETTIKVKRFSRQALDEYQASKKRPGRKRKTEQV